MSYIKQKWKTQVLDETFNKETISSSFLAQTFKEAVEKKHILVDNLLVKSKNSGLILECNIYLLRRFSFLFKRKLNLKTMNAGERFSFYYKGSDVARKLLQRSKNSVMLYDNKKLQQRLAAKYAFERKNFLIKKYLYSILNQMGMSGNVLLIMRILNSQHTRNLRAPAYKEGLQKIANRIFFGYRKLFDLRSKDLMKELSVISVLLAKNDVGPNGYLSILARVFWPLHKRQHNIFYSMVSDIFSLIINQEGNSNTSPIGFRLEIRGKLQGQMKAKHKVISKGAEAKTFRVGKKDVFTPIGTFGFVLYIFFPDSEDVKENACYIFDTELLDAKKKEKKPLIIEKD